MQKGKCQIHRTNKSSRKFSLQKFLYQWMVLEVGIFSKLSAQYRHLAQAQLPLPLHSATRLFLISIVRAHACKDRAMAEETPASTALPAPTPPSTTSPTSSSRWLELTLGFATPVSPTAASVLHCKDTCLKGYSHVTRDSCFHFNTRSYTYYNHLTNYFTRLTLSDTGWNHSLLCCYLFETSTASFTHLLSFSRRLFSFPPGRPDPCWLGHPWIVGKPRFANKWL